jgi:hypothetical protein
MRGTDLAGKVIGRWTVLGNGPSWHHGKRRLICRCACGQERLIDKQNLMRGGTKSCGCSRTGGVKRSAGARRLYKVWIEMIRRCHSQNSKYYYNYGARGITVCQEWRDSLEAFYAHIGDRPTINHSIDRIDNNRGYEPGNVRWATRKVQNRNQRKNILITMDGETRVFADWAEHYGISWSTVKVRLKNGWETERAFKVPTRKHKPYTKVKRKDTPKPRTGGAQ